MSCKVFFFLRQKPWKLQHISPINSLQLENGPLISHLKFDEFVFGAAKIKRFENSFPAVKRLLVFFSGIQTSNCIVFLLEKQVCLKYNPEPYLYLHGQLAVFTFPVLIKAIIFWWLIFIWELSAHITYFLIRSNFKILWLITIYFNEATSI